MGIIAWLKERRRMKEEKAEKERLKTEQERRIADARRVESLIAVIKQDDLGRGPVAEEELAKLNDVRAVACLVQVLESAMSFRIETVVGAITALGKMHAKSAIEPIIKAITALSSHEIPPSWGDIRRDDIRNATVQALSELGQAGASVDPITNALNHSDYEVRVIAALSLAKLGNPAGVHVIGRDLGSTNSNDDGVRDYISKIELLGTLGDNRATPYLIKAGQDGFGGLAALRVVVEALRKLQTPEAIAEANRIETRIIPPLCSVTFPYGFPDADVPSSRSPITLKFNEGVCRVSERDLTWNVKLFPDGHTASWWCSPHPRKFVEHFGATMKTCPKCAVPYAFYEVGKGSGQCRACGHVVHYTNWD